ncbi:hypothetical protein MNBD_GAMMA26-1138 [hydrothermal vent metagenome]|uniref:Succinate dehydrogenase cytochrome b-556 subunit n=1 Tax=hydrothermal vent metagenome TaxID=652676 RepID=A0A3B1BE45_9ZZZZ
MTKNKKRPIHLDLRRIRLPVNAVTSIGHRVGGVLMFFLVPATIFLFDLSLTDTEGFAMAVAILDSTLVKGLMLLVLWAFAHHVLAGARCMAIDRDIGIDKPVFMQTAFAVLLAAPPVAFLLWVLL